MGTRGDPLFDLATLLSYWCEPHEADIFGELDQMPTASPGFWSRAQAAEAYAKATGQDLSDLPSLLVLALLRLGVVFLQLHDQHRSGAATNPRYATFDRCALKVLEHAHGKLHSTGLTV
jgi:aminoglycoside phosphotransferase (APT) family kinase protein